MDVEEYVRVDENGVMRVGKKQRRRHLARCEEKPLQVRVCPLKCRDIFVFAVGSSPRWHCEYESCLARVVSNGWVKSGDGGPPA